MILNVVSVLLWIPAMLARVVFILLGLVAVPFTGPEHRIWGNYEDPTARSWYRPNAPEWFRNYMWRAVRNPANNLRYRFKQPAFYDSVAGAPDVDKRVYYGGHRSAWRWTRAGLYSEFWYLRQVGDQKFEVRIGWKFSGVPGFMITSQVRLGQ